MPEDEAIQDGTPQETRYFTQADLDAAIQEALKSQKPSPQVAKSDPRFQEMTAELKELRAFQRKAEKQEQERLAAIEAEKKRAAEAEMSAKELLEKRQAEFDARLAGFQAENEQRVALMEKEIQLSRLQAYVQRRVNEERDNIAPQLIGFIDGNSEEEVEASIERVKATTSEIMEEVRSSATRLRAGMPGVSASAGTNGVTPLDEPASRELSADDIRGMGMKEFAALREKLGMAGVSNQGLFRA